MNIKIGDTFEFSKQITDQLIRDFASVSGDHNPIHLDDDFAAGTRFGKRIGHGMLTASFLSALLGSSLSVQKIVYLGQTLKFTAPAFIGDMVTARGTVKHIREDKPVITIDTVCTNQDGTILIEGEAILMLLD